jgi:hypothetical protein
MIFISQYSFRIVLDDIDNEEEVENDVSKKKLPASSTIISATISSFTSQNAFVSSTTLMQTYILNHLHPSLVSLKKAAPTGQSSRA